MNDLRGVRDAEVTVLLNRWSDGDRSALDQLMPLVYTELRRLAERHMRGERDPHTLARTGLVNELYLRLTNQRSLNVRCRAQFFGLASTMMRNILVDHARARRASKRNDGLTALSLATGPTFASGVPAHVESAQAAPDDSLDLIALDESLRRLEDLDPRQARVVEMRFFLGLSVDESAEMLQLSPTTIKREWATARAWLLRDLGCGSAGASHDTGAPLVA